VFGVDGATGYDSYEIDDVQRPVAVHRSYHTTYTHNIKHACPNPSTDSETHLVFLVKREDQTLIHSTLD
jgi:hypothetical protein